MFTVTRGTARSRRRVFLADAVCSQHLNKKIIPTTAPNTVFNRARLNYADAESAVPELL